MLPPHWLGTVRAPLVASGASGEVMEEPMAVATLAAAMVVSTAALAAVHMDLETATATVESEGTTMTPERAKGL